MSIGAKAFDGGPAFPVCPPDYSSQHSSEGMSLRDYFAAQVLASVAAQAINESVAKGKDQKESLAVVAYAYADAMLDARK